MSDIQIATGILLLSVFISSVSQILLKISANKKHSSKIKEYLNRYVIIGYTFFFTSTILTMMSLRILPLSMAPMIESVSYIFVSIMGYYILKEKFSKMKIAGLLLIMVGVLVVSL